MTQDQPAVQHDMLDVLGMKVNLVDCAYAMDQIEDWISADGETRTIIVTGFHGLHVALDDPDFRDLIGEADLFVPDGIAPLLISRRLGLRDHGRVTGADLMQGFFDLANKKGYSSYFFGDTDETLAALQEKVEAHWPGHKVAGMFSPPFGATSEEEVDRMIAAINDAKPDVLWVGLGLPKQERWIRANRHKLKVPVAIGVGAAFGFHSGKVSRVPAWIGKGGFEWMWRLLAEPKKLWRRSLIDGPRFVFGIVSNWSAIKKANSQ